MQLNSLKGGRGSQAPLRFFQNIFCLKTILNHSLTAKTRFAHSLSFILCIGVEVTMNMAEYYSRRSQQPENVNFGPIKIRC